MKIPLFRPAPPQLSLAFAELQSLEQSGIFSNFGPVNTCFEEEMLARFFGGEGACMTVCNATIGLMLAIKEAIGERWAKRWPKPPLDNLPSCRASPSQPLRTRRFGAA